MKKTYRIVALLFVIALLPFLSSCNKDSEEGKKGSGDVGEKSECCLSNEAAFRRGSKRMEICRQSGKSRFGIYL